MTDNKSSPITYKLEPLDPNDQPPQDRFCDVVLDGGVINGVVYPGFLLELARKFHFRSLGGTSVGAIAAALAAACEYNRRFQGLNGFNEGLAKMPEDLAYHVDEPKKMTKIRSLFQPDPKVQRLFDWIVDVLGTYGVGADNPNNQDTNSKTEPSSIKRIFFDGVLKAANHFRPSALMYFIYFIATAWVGKIMMSDIDISLHKALPILVTDCLIFISLVFVFHPILVFISQLRTLALLPGSGACTGIRTNPDNKEGLFEWLNDGIQKAANLPSHKPLTFADLWQAPCGPKAADGNQEPRSIDLRMITTCLSHGRIYELPFVDDRDILMFSLDDFKPYFPKEIIAHLRRVSKPMTVKSCTLLRKKISKRKKELRSVPNFKKTDPEFVKFTSDMNKVLRRLNKEFKKFECEKDGCANKELKCNSIDIREFPKGDLPILVAARMSMSCPILFQNIPLMGFNLDVNIQDISIVRLWFSDGGIGSNFPIHLFDKPIPRWPTFGVKILNETPRLDSKGNSLKAHIPFGHKDGFEDNLLYPNDTSGFTAIGKKSNVDSFLKTVYSIYTSAKDGHDQSYFRMPDVRNRMVRVYLDNRAGNAFNLKISQKNIVDLAVDVGAYGGRLAAQAYLAQNPNPKYNWVNSWQDHRWVRFNMLTKGLRNYLQGFTHAVHLDALPGSANQNTLIEQVLQATQNPPLKSRNIPSDETVLTQDQSNQLLEIINAISLLENQLQALNMPQPYSPQPMPELRFKPRA